MERIAGNIIMMTGSTMLFIPGLRLGGVTLICVGLFISADANGVISDYSNLTRIANTGIDFVTSAIPYGKFFGIIEESTVVGFKFIKLTDTISSFTKNIFTGEDVLESIICSAVTFIGEYYTMGGRENGIVDVIYDC